MLSSVVGVSMKMDATKNAYLPSWKMLNVQHQEDNQEVWKLAKQ